VTLRLGGIGIGIGIGIRPIAGSRAGVSAQSDGRSRP